MQVLNWIRDDKQLFGVVLTHSRRGNDVIHLRALEALPRRLQPQTLQQAWQMLERAQAGDPALPAALQTVLNQSRPLAWKSQNLAEPLLEARSRFKASAAHPRAYKGTKSRPPKTGRHTLDLRPYLQDPRWVQHLLRQVQQEQAWQVESQKQIGAHPLFYQAVLPLLRDGDGLADQYADLVKNWPQPERTLPRLCRLLLSCDPVSLLAFLQAARHPLPDLLNVLCSWSSSDLIDCSRLDVFLALLAWRKEQIKEKRPYDLPAQLAFVLRALQARTDQGYLIAGIEILRKYHGWYLFDHRQASRTASSGKDFDLALAEAVHRHCEQAESKWRNYDLLLRLWERWGEAPALAKCFSQIDWFGLTPDVASALLFLLVQDFDEWWGEPPRTSWQGYHAFLCRLIPQILEQLPEVPERWQPQWIRLLADDYSLLYKSEPYRRELAEPRMQRAMRFFAHLTREPFSPLLENSETFSPWIARLSDADFERFCKLPDKVLLSLAKAANQRDQRNYLRDGLDALLAAAPSFCLEAVAASPRSLLRMAHQLGLLSETERHETTARFATSPLLTRALAAMPLADLLSQLLPLCQIHGLPSPFPRKLRAWQENRHQLTPGQLERARNKSLQQLTPMRITYLEALVQEQIFASFPQAPRTEAIQHALLLEKNTPYNRRALRRFLKALFAGRQDYLHQHPLNRHWLKRHPEADHPAWRGPGPVLAYECCVQGQTLSLRIEHDPFEVLKMGTYVASCLSLGGSYMYSAIAVLLDLNKQVVFARNAQGDVIARQLLAITDSGSLAGFWVYPAQSVKLKTEILDAHFLAFQRQLAQTLGLRLLAQEQHEDAISLLLAQEWWDDGFWAKPSIYST